MWDEAFLRLSIFIAVLFMLFGLETYFKRRQLPLPRLARWRTNVGLLVVGAVLLRITITLLPVAGVAWAAEQQFGLFNWLALPTVVVWCLGLLALDFAIWLQHVVTHNVPWLWRLHRVHHSDLALDSSSALRFHPAEIVLSMLYKIGIASALGVPAAVLFWFEVLLNAAAMFNHANLKLPLKVDAVLRRFIVTPDMHRVHHSVNVAEHNHNFGFLLAGWDRLFGTYTAQPAAGHMAMQLGLPTQNSPEQQTLRYLLRWPFRRK